MTQKKGQTPDASDLRQRAEERLKGRQKEEAAASGEADARRLVHELEVHQVELEMQNEELQAARAELEAGLAGYTDLYDFAPTGYFTLTGDGTLRPGMYADVRLESNRLPNRIIVPASAVIDYLSPAPVQHAR